MMGTVQKGGYYIGSDGTPHDAWGEPIDDPIADEPPDEAADVASEDAPTEEPLPDDFPGRALLVEAGRETLEAVRAAEDAALLAITGIGPATLEAIREEQ